MRPLRSFAMVVVVAAFVLPASPARTAPSTLEAGAYVMDLAASPDGRWLAAAPTDLPPVLFHVGPAPEAAAEGAEPPAPPPERRVLACPNASIDSLVFTPDSRFLVVKPDLEDGAAKVLVFATETAEPAFEIDCAAPAPGRGVGPKHVWAIRPGPAPSQFYVARNDGLAIWDAETKEMVSQDAKLDPTDVFIASDGSVAVAETGSRILVLDPASGAERRRIEEEASEGQLPPATKKNQVVLGMDMSLVGISPDGAVVVASCTQEKVMDQNKLANPSASAEDRLKAIKRYSWLEGFHTETGKSAWVAKLTDRVYASDVRCVGERICVEVDDDLRLFDIRTGKAKGKISASGHITAQASADGETWWYADDEGRIRSK